MGLVYGDYYFIEALLRFNGEAETPVEPPESPPPEQPRPARWTGAAIPVESAGWSPAALLLLALRWRRREPPARR